MIYQTGINNNVQRFSERRKCWASADPDKCGMLIRFRESPFAWKKVGAATFERTITRFLRVRPQRAVFVRFILASNTIISVVNVAVPKTMGKTRSDTRRVSSTGDRLTAPSTSVVKLKNNLRARDKSHRDEPKIKQHVQAKTSNVHINIDIVRKQ